VFKKPISGDWRSAFSLGDAWEAWKEVMPMLEK